MKGLVLIGGMTVKVHAFVTDIGIRSPSRPGFNIPGVEPQILTRKNLGRSQGYLDVIVKYNSDGKRTKSPSQQHIILLTEIFQFMTYA